jgi:hypothetical protein
LNESLVQQNPNEDVQDINLRAQVSIDVDQNTILTLQMPVMAEPNFDDIVDDQNLDEFNGSPLLKRQRSSLQQRTVSGM